MGRKFNDEQVKGGDIPTPPGYEEIPPPPPLIDGVPNRKHYQIRASNVGKVVERFALAGQPVPVNIASVHKSIIEEAKIAGFTERDIFEERSEADVIRDSVDRLLEAPDTLFELTDNMLEVLDRRMVEAVRHCEEAIAKLRESAGEKRDEMGEWKEKARRGKAMCDRLKRVRRLREMARNPNPRGLFVPLRVSRYAVEASHVLRYMLYVGRSGMGKNEGSAEDLAFRVGKHHGELAETIWRGMNGAEYTNDGVLEGVTNYQGVILISPPGHGKTELAVHFGGLQAHLDPNTQAVLLHAGYDKAAEGVDYIAAQFDPKTAQGRRAISLFNRKLVRKNQQGFIVSGRKHTIKQPTFQAAGVTSSGLSGNTNLQLWDDVIPQSDVSSESERKRRYDLLGGTWLTRQRGTKTFVLWTGYLWHHDDAMSKYISAVRNGKAKWLVRIQRVGEPPNHRPLWPEVYPEAELRKRYAVSNTAQWAANYLAQPKMDEGRIIKEIRLYDPNERSGSPGSEWNVQERFLQRAQYHLSIDPSAVNRKGADKTGIIYAAVGETERLIFKNGVEYVHRENRLRLLDCREMHATQSEIAEHALGYALEHRVDEIHIETVTGFAGLAEMIERDIPGAKVIRHKPANKNKEQRLRMCANLIENTKPTHASDDYPGAVVEFPGVRNENGELVLSPAFKELATQILDFGVCAQDHMLDATTQLLNHLAHQFHREYGGEFSALVRQATVNHARDERITAMLKVRLAEVNATDDDRELAFWDN